MTTHEDTRTSSAITRRGALKSTASLAALALPAGAAVAAGHTLPNLEANPEALRRFAIGDADPGLDAIEAGYARWVWLVNERDRLQELRDELKDRARAERPMLEPAPTVPAKLKPYAHEWGDGYITVVLGTVPKRLNKLADAYIEAEVDWRNRHPALDGHPDYEASLAANGEAEDREAESEDVKNEVLAIQTRSPHGVLIKLALAAEVRSLDDLDQAITDDTLYQSPWIGEDLLPHLAADLRAMVGEAVA